MEGMKTFIDIYLFYMLYMISIIETDVNFTWAVDKSWKDFHVIPKHILKIIHLLIWYFALLFLSVVEIFGNYALSLIIQLYCDMSQKRESSNNYFMTAVCSIHILMIYRSHSNLLSIWGRIWMLDWVYKYFWSLMLWIEMSFMVGYVN